MAAAAVAGAAIFTTMMAQTSAANDRTAALNDEKRMAEMNAMNARTEAVFNAARVQSVANKKFGEVEAGYAASGVDSGYGSAATVLAESHRNAEMDRQSVLWGGKINEMNQIARSRAADSAIGRVNQARGINAFATLAGGAANIYGRYGGSSLDEG